MKAISLWQPWASLIALGEKRIETRTWEAPHELIGERIAIHAAKRWTGEQAHVCDQEPFLSVLGERFGFSIAHHAYARDLILRENLPFGAIVATAKLKYCFRMAGVGTIYDEAGNPHRDGLRLVDKFGDSLDISKQEALFGHYAPGRYVWRLGDIRPLETPIPYRGAQGLFEVNLPELEALGA